MNKKSAHLCLEGGQIGRGCNFIILEEADWILTAPNICAKLLLYLATPVIQI